MAMKIANAKIENSTFGFMYTNSVLCAKLKIATMENGYLSHYELSFDFRNPEDVLRLAELMRITEVSEFSDLNGKYIRIGYISGRGCFGFGNLMEDKFIPMKSEKFVEVSEKEFTEISLNFLEENFRGSRMPKD